MHFLPNLSSKGHTRFAGTDLPELFEKNLKIMPDTWHYRTKNIDYKYNKFKYRTYEFDNIDWNNSIVLFGCSHVFGVGVDEDETLSYFIEKLTGIPTINMGIAGSSIYHSYYNILSLLEINVQPVAFVHVYTAIDRLIYYSDGDPVSLGNWTMYNSVKSLENHKNLYKFWTYDDSNFIGHAKVLQRSLSLLCKNIKYFECSYFLNTVHSLGMTYLDIVDKGRDLLHPGIETNKKSASIIIESLKL